MAESSLCWIYTLIIFTIISGTGGIYSYWFIECLYTTEDMKYFDYKETIFINMDKVLEYNDILNKYVADTDVGKIIAAKRNSDPQTIERIKIRKIDLCMGPNHQYSAINKTVKPRVQLKPLKNVDELDPVALMCSAHNFYPKTIKISWLRNGAEVNPNLILTEELANGDWYYQKHSYLMYTPLPGEKITCVVEHKSLSQPLKIQWETGHYDLNNYIIGSVGIGVGLIIVIAGLIYYKKHKVRKQHGRRAWQTDSQVSDATSECSTL